MTEEAKSGEWYIGVSCKKCHKPIVLFHDPSKGKTRMTGPGKLQVTCPDPDCRHEALYGTDELWRGQLEYTH